jgi:DNA-binding GntR family transcriptional regulator
VKTVPNKGAVVVGVSAKDILDIYTIRMRIESLASRWAATNIMDSELDALREVVELQTFYVSRGDAMQVWNLDTRFHEIIFEACRSRPLRHTLSGFHHYIQKAREMSFKTAGRAALSVEEHRAILDAITAHDPDAAERLTALHIEHARKNVADNLGERE